MNNAPKNTNNDVHIDVRLAIVVLVTFCLFMVSTLAMTVGLVADAVEGIQGGVEQDDEDSRDKPNKETKPSTPVSKQSEPGVKTGIVLPSTTEEGAYFGVVNDKTKDVSTDADLQSAATVLVDITDNVVVAGKNADVKIYPASMTKVMTLLVACENAQDPNALLTLTKEMTDKYKKSENQGASLAFEWQEGWQITVEDALHTIIYGSDTYACWLIAENVAGGEEQFVAMMNEKAVELGLTNTHFTNCTGLYNAEHYTTCREMAAIMAAAMNNETATRVLGRKEMYTVNVYSEGEKTDVSADMWSAWYTGRLEEHRYANTAPYYAGKGSDVMIVGGKTGYETIPTNCFVTAGVDDLTGRRYVCVQVGRIDKNQTSVNSSTSTYDTREMYWKYAKEPDER